MIGPPTSPIGLLVALAISIRAVHLVLLRVLSYVIPPFDDSHTILSNTLLPGLRWDAIHFMSIAKSGYEWEQQLAFQPGWMAMLHAGGRGRAWAAGKVVGVDELVWAGMILAAVSWIGAAVMLDKTTSYLFNSRFAFLTTLLYLIPPTPIPSLPYTEPLYALTTFTGLYLLTVKRQYLFSGIAFAASTGIRATGIFNVLILMGIAIIGDVRPRDLRVKKFVKRCLTHSWKAVIPSLISIVPFLAFQLYAYMSFCGQSGISSRPWCENGLPSAYGFVQKEYWGNGLFKYWTISNIPNIILPLPIIFISFLGTYKYLKSLIQPKPTQPSPKPELLVIYIHHILMMSLMLFASHTQILLRTCITDPVIWWNMAGLAVDWGGGQGKSIKMTRIGKWWIGWTLIWGAISTVLWVGHYPPA
ncbi:uncharacterized protein IL334_001015 [Kwoniella shivajii]|uniref:GPI mannosyltransferase 2 n=1 Tax=Kwoniella shivajii TaxID=564305 RepID=A0ABZ1CTV3_9TREE|nr:hypothetical protein IL334_001015 [Kwoniella shivajii]